MYSIGVIDKVTGPVNKIMAKINRLGEQTAAAQEQMFRGMATSVGGAYALANSLTPAIDQVAALGEVQSLGVTGEAIEQLNKTSFEFVTNFGGNAAEFVRSAYDIQSAISGLNASELSEFTKTSNMLAVATKADAATITSYMGTMYGIFEKTANKMGKAKWVNQIAGQTATAVQLYKTTGAEMQAAFANLSNKATNVGLSAAQQFAMVGQLQLVAPSASVAGSQAAKFIGGIGKAQQKLGIELTNEQGDMLAIDVVLSRINERLSSLGSVAKSNVLKKLFGEQGATAINVLGNKVESLTTDIQHFEQIQTQSKAAEMANIIASPWDRLGGSFNAAATAMGQRLLPVVEPFVEMIAAAFAGVVKFTEQFPLLSSAIATVVVGVVGLITVFGLATFLMGLFNYASKLGLSITGAQIALSKLWQGVLITQNAVMTAARFATLNYGNAMMFAGAMMSRLQSMGIAGVLSLIAAKFSAAATAAWTFASALLANPLTWIVLAVVAVIAAVGALVYYLDEISNAFSTWADQSMIWQGMRVAFDLITLPLQLIWHLIKQIGSALYDFFAPAFSAIGELANSLGTQVSGFFTNIFSDIASVINDVTVYMQNAFGGVIGFFSNVYASVNNITNSITAFLKDIANNGVLNMVLDFFADNEQTVKTLSEPSALKSTQAITHNQHNEQIASLRTHAALNQTRLNTQFNNVHALQPMQQNQQQNQHFATNVIPFNSQQINKSLSTQTIQNEQLTKLANTHVTHSAINQATNTGLNQTRLNTQLNNVHALQPMQHYQHKQQNQHFTNNVIPLNTQTTNSATRIQTVQNTAVNQAINPVSYAHTQQNEQLTKLAYLNQDHALTNNLSTTNTEHTNQNATSSYTSTAKKSPFLQSLAKSYSVNTSNSNADNSKNVHIEHVTVKTDDVAKTFEDMMELAG